MRYTGRVLFLGFLLLSLTGCNSGKIEKVGDKIFYIDSFGKIYEYISSKFFETKIVDRSNFRKKIYDNIPVGPKGNLIGALNIFFINNSIFYIIEIKPKYINLESDRDPKLRYNEKGPVNFDEISDKDFKITKDEYEKLIRAENERRNTLKIVQDLNISEAKNLFETYRKFYVNLYYDRFKLNFIEIDQFSKATNIVSSTGEKEGLYFEGSMPFDPDSYELINNASVSWINK